MKKEHLRQLYREKRRDLTKIEVYKQSEQIKAQWLNSPFANFHSYHLFLPIHRLREINTYLLLTTLWENEKKTYCSKIMGDELLHFRLTEETLFARNEWDILEPSNETPISTEELHSIECIFVPLLVADRSGHRIGYGKGYYDRFLAELDQAITVGLSGFSLVDEIIDIEAHDIPLDAIITPKKVNRIH